MAVSIADQCVERTGLEVTTNGTPAQYNYGDVLPAATTAADQAARATLRSGGLLRQVTACTALSDFNAAAMAAAIQAATLEAASTGTPYNKPVLIVAGSPPVVANY